MRLDCSAPYDTRPRIEQGTVYIPWSDANSHVYVNTKNLIVVDFFVSRERELEWYFFLDNTRIEWSELEDNQRLLIRVRAAQYWGHSEYRYVPGEYKDNRYHTLEALCD